jgi:RNA polymerase sigma-70 factor (ECF subfamily)
MRMTTQLWERCANSAKLLPLFLPVTQARIIRAVSDDIQQYRELKTRSNIGQLSAPEAPALYDLHTSLRSVPGVLCGSHPGMTFPSEKNRFLSQAFNELSDGLYGYAMVLSRDRTEAEDLVQETCVRAMQAMESVRPGSNVKSWWFTILRNIWLNRLRRGRAAPKMVEIDGDESTAQSAVATTKDPHALYVSKVECELVREAILQLSDDFREIIVLREYEDLSYQEIATLLGCPAGTVMSRLGRARSKLRSLLAASLGSPD